MATGNLLEIVSNVLDRKAYAWNHDSFPSLWTKHLLTCLGRRWNWQAHRFWLITQATKSRRICQHLLEAAILTASSRKSAHCRIVPNNPAPAKRSHSIRQLASAAGVRSGWQWNIGTCIASADVARAVITWIVFWDSLVGNGKPAPWPMVWSESSPRNLYPHELPLASGIIAHHPGGHEVRESRET